MRTEHNETHYLCWFSYELIRLGVLRPCRIIGVAHRRSMMLFSVHSHLLAIPTVLTECPLFTTAESSSCFRHHAQTLVHCEFQHHSHLLRAGYTSFLQSCQGLRLNTTMLGRSDHAPYSGGYLPRYQSVAQPVVQLGVRLFVCRILTHLKARYRKRHRQQPQVSYLCSTQSFRTMQFIWQVHPSSEARRKVPV